MRSTSQGALFYILAYLLWLVSIAACVAAVLQLQSAVNALGAALGGNRYTLRLANQVILLLGGLAAFTYAVFLEGYYRDSVKAKARPPEAGGAPAVSAQGARRHRLFRWLSGTGPAVLLRRFAITIAIPLGVIGLSLVLVEVALRIMTS